MNNFGYGSTCTWMLDGESWIHGHRERTEAGEQITSMAFLPHLIPALGVFIRAQIGGCPAEDRLIVEVQHII